MTINLNDKPQHNTALATLIKFITSEDVYYKECKPINKPHEDVFLSAVSGNPHPNHTLTFKHQIKPSDKIDLGCHTVTDSIVTIDVHLQASHSTTPELKEAGVLDYTLIHINQVRAYQERYSGMHPFLYKMDSPTLKLTPFFKDFFNLIQSEVSNILTPKPVNEKLLELALFNKKVT